MTIKNKFIAVTLVVFTQFCGNALGMEPVKEELPMSEEQELELALRLSMQDPCATEEEYQELREKIKFELEHFGVETKHQNDDSEIIKTVMRSLRKCLQEQTQCVRNSKIICDLTVTVDNGSDDESDDLGFSPDTMGQIISMCKREQEESQMSWEEKLQRTEEEELKRAIELSLQDFGAAGEKY